MSTLLLFILVPQNSAFDFAFINRRNRMRYQRQFNFSELCWVQIALLRLDCKHILTNNKKLGKIKKEGKNYHLSPVLWKAKCSLVVLLRLQRMIIRYSVLPGSISPKSISSIEKKTLDPKGETSERCDGISSYC